LFSNPHFTYIHIPFLGNDFILFVICFAMDRRIAVKKIIIASGSLITLPFWMTGCGSNDTAATHLSSFSATEQEILAAVTDTIIPAGNAIGALSVGVDKYLQKLIDNCYEKDVQDNVKAQLKGLETSAQGAYKKSFSKCDPMQRQEMLLKLSTSDKKPEKDFFTLIKSETINGFNTSKEVMVNYFHYMAAPGHYYGCVDVKA
jgi:Gluconate 2-dehydrogenase subunit 3